MPRNYKTLNSVEKAVDILYLMASQDGEMGISQLARLYGTTKTTIYRILYTLETKQLVAYNPSNQKYRLGMGLLVLGNIVEKQQDLIKYAKPVMNSLVKRTGETVTLKVPDHDKALTVEVVEGSHELRQMPKVGERASFHEGAIGKVMLAFFDQERIEAFLKRLSSAHHPQIDLERLTKELQDIRKQGYAVTYGERLPGTWGVGAPIFNHLGQAVASIGISGPMTRFSKELVEEYANLLVKETFTLSCQLGFGLIESGTNSEAPVIRK